MTKLIPLTKGYSAIVDDADFEWLSQWKWSLISDRYAARFEGPKHCRQLVLMHRFIMNASAPLEVDHINRNKLDCQRSNLRIVTHSQNMQNKPRQKRSKSRFKGVHPHHSKTAHWIAVIRTQEKTVRLGVFSSDTEAAHAYDAAALHYFGEFAYINFPQEPQP